jgi:acyl carrier protein
MMFREEYDVALSFAGEDRAYAKELADSLRRRGIAVFYDEYAKADMWGKDLYDHLSEVYEDRAEYVVMFISKHYADKVWTTHERRSAQARALNESREYILPIRLDDVGVGGVLQNISHLSWPPEDADSIADIIQIKLNKLPGRGGGPAPAVGTPGELYLRVVKVVSDTLGVKEERVTPTAYFKEDLNADSLKLAALAMDVEEEFGIEIPDEEAERLDCAVDLYKCVREKVKVDDPAAGRPGQFPFRPEKNLRRVRLGGRRAACAVPRDVVGGTAFGVRSHGPTSLPVLLQEAGDAGAAVFGHARDGVGVGAGLERGVEVEAVHVVEQPLGELDGGAADALEVGDVAFDVRLEVRVLEDVVNQP